MEGDAKKISFDRGFVERDIGGVVGEGVVAEVLAVEVEELVDALVGVDSEDLAQRRKGPTADCFESCLEVELRFADWFDSVQSLHIFVDRYPRELEGQDHRFFPSPSYVLRCSIVLQR
jgi:hypothetical protein